MSLREENKAEDSLQTVIPTHLGFILDGNRRWAKKRGLPSFEGHRKGLNKVTELIDACLDMGVKHLTVFAFSTENWQRSEAEVGYLMGLFRLMFEKMAAKYSKKGVSLRIAGRLQDFPEDVQKMAQKGIDDTKDNTSLIFNVAFSYGGRAEIVDATKKIIEAGLKPEEITEEKFAEYIYEAGQPDPDMIIRTSGEQRTSGFMLWQAAYSELYFIDIDWPDFNRETLKQVIGEYQARERRFGK